MLKLKSTSFIKQIVLTWVPQCCLSKGLTKRKRQLQAGERRIYRQLDVEHFIQNAIMLKALAKLSLSKTDRFLVRRQPKVHLLDKISSASSDSTQNPTNNAYSQGDLSGYGPKLVDLYFGTNEKASEPISLEQRSPSVASTVPHQQYQTQSQINIHDISNDQNIS